MVLASAKAVLVLAASVLTLGEAGFLASTTAAPPSDEASVDDQIAALQGQIAAQETKVVAAGGKIETDESWRHCKPAARAALEKASGKAPIEEKKEDGPLAAQLEASNRKSLVENEEFLLGLLIMHQTRQNWSYEQELDAICDLAHDSPLITNLYKNHKKDIPLSTQLATMMDEERKHMKPTVAPPMSLEGDSVGSLIKKLTR